MIWHTELPSSFHFPHTLRSMPRSRNLLHYSRHSDSSLIINQILQHGNTLKCVVPKHLLIHFYEQLKYKVVSSIITSSRHMTISIHILRSILFIGKENYAFKWRRPQQTITVSNLISYLRIHTVNKF